jgi:Ca-activated chloride channel family protein
MIGDFHFLRPLWLAGVPAALLLLWIVGRREDVRRRWRDVIAPHLLDRLIVDPRGRLRFRPVHLAVAGLVIGSIAAAGPTWDRERPPFVEDKAPMAIAIELSQTMDAADVTPTRLERAKLKIRDLLARRSGARTAVFAYAGTAHLVLPLTDDATLIETYLQALATNVMPVSGRNTAEALKVVDTWMARETVPGTILFITDGVEAAAVNAFAAHQGPHQILVLGVGTELGGPVPTGPDTFLTDATGRRVFTKLDVESLKKLHSEANIPVATMTTDDSDVDWIQREAQSHLERKESDLQTRWRDQGWWLAIPFALLGAFWFRRGWTIRWVAGLVFVATLGTAAPAHAADWRFADMWLTPDQQGRYYFDRGDYLTAADRFEDPMWKGVAFYRAGKYQEAFESFSRVDTAESYYNQGNALAKLGKFPVAVASYEEALKRRPGWHEAEANMTLVKSLIPPKPPDQDYGEATTLKADQIKFDEMAKKGKKGPVDVRQQSAEMWMRNIHTSPHDLLERKFAIEAAQQRAEQKK